MQRKHTNRILVLLIFCAVSVGCSTLINGKPAAESAVVEFHSMLDEGKFAEIYAATDQSFKDATSEADIIKIFNAVHSKLGTVKESTNKTWRVNNYNLTNYILLVQDTEFENGKGTESFTFVIHDNKAVMAGYYINSIDLMSLN